MAKKARKAVQRGNRRTKKVHWLWPFWPLVPMTDELIDAGVELARARGEFWSEAFYAAGEVLEDWRDKVSRQSS